MIVHVLMQKILGLDETVETPRLCDLFSPISVLCFLWSPFCQIRNLGMTSIAGLKRAGSLISDLMEDKSQKVFVPLETADVGKAASKLRASFVLCSLYMYI